MTLRDANKDDFPAILALNETFVHYLSPLTMEGLENLHVQSALHRVIVDDGRVVAFMLVLAEGANSDGPNFRWFVGRFARFLYIDRIVVAASHQQSGLASRLYLDLFAFAAEKQVPVVAAEYDLIPANDASARFHAKHGFTRGRNTGST